MVNKISIFDTSIEVLGERKRESIFSNVGFLLNPDYGGNPSFLT